MESRFGCGLYFLVVVLAIIAVFSVGCLRSAEESHIPDSGEHGTLYESESETVAVTEALTEAPTEAATEMPPVEPEFELGVYVSSGSEYVRVAQYESHWPQSPSDPLWVADTWTYPGRTNLICDTAYFGIFPFASATHPFVDYEDEYMALWRAEGLDGYEIGLEFTVELADGSERRFSVRSAEDTFKFEEYFEIYLYDDVAHSTDSWYSHITEATTYDDTLITTFKITLREGCYDIEKITAAVYVYHDNSEFDSDGFYTGVNKTMVVICDEEE